MRKIVLDSGISYALLAAVLFGAGMPLAKFLTVHMPPVLLAGLLYLGSGIGLSAWLALHALFKTADESARLAVGDLPWLAAAILAGGVLGPVLLMAGLSRLPAASASLLLNLEGVFTTLLAWFAFREPFDKRIFSGMVLIALAGFLLSWQGGASLVREVDLPSGALAVVAACLCWAVDNNLTRKVSANDATQIAAIKGIVAAAVNLLVAFGWQRLPPPALPEIAGAATIGFLGYGVSLVFFVLALRHLGSARTGAYFSTAPFIGAAISLLLTQETPTPAFWPAAAMMAIGIWLHLTEKHSHPHTHARITHSHSHVHDEHHRHRHDFAWDGKEPHTHPHEHEPLAHTHPHFPDIHHRHRH